MTSTEAYKISSNLKELAFTTESVINTIKSAKVSVNENQLGDIPDTISAALDNQIVILKSAESNLSLASTKAKIYADELKRKEQERLKLKNEPTKQEIEQKNIKNKINGITTRKDVLQQRMII